MTDPINFRALCVNLLDCLEKADWPPRYRHVFEQWVYIARKALTEMADGPAVPEGREPAAVARQPSDEELLGLHCLTTKQLRASGKGECNHLTAFARAVLDRWGRPAQPAPPAEGEVAELVNMLTGIAYWKRRGRPGEGDPSPFDIRQADRLTRAAELLERHAAPVPVPVSERPWEREGWCDMDGECWWCPPDGPAYWSMVNPAMVYGGWLLPHWAIHQPPSVPALPLPAPQGGEVEP